MTRFIVYIAKEDPGPDMHAKIAEKIDEQLSRRKLTIVGRFADRRMGLLALRPDVKPMVAFSCLHDRDGVMCAAEGYLYNRADVWGTYAETRDGSVGDADVIAESIRRAGAKMVGVCQGQFTALRYDHKTGEVLIVTDRYGLKPLYSAETTDYFLFSHDLKLMLDTFQIPRVLDRACAAQLVSMELVFEDRTLIEAIKRIPNAAIVHVRDRHLSVSQYWDYPFHEQSYLSDRREILDLLKFHIDKAIKTEFSKAPDTTVIPLSGGMDSRMIVAYADRHGQRPLNTFTFATNSSRCPERWYAEQVAKAVNAHWDYEDWREALPIINARWPEFIVWTGGWQSVHQSGMYQAYRRFSQLRGYTRALVGYAFDAQLGGNAFSLSATDDFAVTVENLWALWSTSGDIASRYFTQAFVNEIVQGTRARLRDRVRHMNRARPSEIADYFLWIARLRSYTAADANSNRAIVHIGMPYLDYDLFDLCMRIPHELKKNHDLYFQLFLEEFPHLCAIPYSHTGVAVGQRPRFRQKFKRYLSGLEYRLTRLSHGLLERDPITGAGCFRHRPDARQVYLDLMQARKTEELGLVLPDGLKRLIEDVDAGKDYVFEFLERIGTIEQGITYILEAR